MVTRSTRISTAAVLLLAVTALPSMLDQCAASCVEHHEAVASTPSCHHATATTNHIGPMPTPCGHDHSGTTVTSAKTSAPVQRGLDSIVAVVALPAALAPASSDGRLPGHSPPGARRPVGARPLPLRI
jgi:hypothetical protein